MVLCLKLQAIPKKFSNNLKNKLPELVTLKGPGGGAWRVGITTIDDTWFFKHGWQEFVNDHGLAEHDLLIFKYNGESHFEVLIFDGQSLCEKEFSYFVKKCGHKRDDQGGNLTKRKSMGTSCDQTNNASSENIGCISAEKSKDDDDPQVPSEEPVITPTPERRTRRKKSTVKRSSISSKDEGVLVPSGEPIITPTADKQVNAKATSDRPVRATRGRRAASKGASPYSGELVSITGMYFDLFKDDLLVMNLPLSPFPPINDEANSVLISKFYGERGEADINLSTSHCIEPPWFVRITLLTWLI